MSSLIDAVLDKKEEIASNTYEITFKVETPFNFKPGQYVWVILSALNYPDPKGERRSFSIASSAQDKSRISIILRGSDTGFKKTLLESIVGTKVKLRGPQGQNFVLGGDETNVCFIAGGVGIAPFLGSIRSNVTLPPRAEVALVNLNSTGERKFLTSEIEKLTSARSIKFIDHTGPFDVSLLRSLTNPKNATYYICGPEAMVNDVYQKLKFWGIADSQMRFEQYYPSPTQTLKGLPETPSDEGTPESLRERIVRRLYIYYYYAVFSAIGVLVLVYTLFLGSSLSQMTILYVTFGLLASNYIIYKLTKNLKFLLTGTIALTVVIFGWVLWYGVLNGVAVYWLYFFPVLAFFSLGRRGGTIWTAIYTIMVGAIYLLSSEHMTPYFYSLTPSVLSLLSLIYISLLSYFADYITEEMVGSLGASISLRQSFKMAVESSSDHIIITDVNGVILYANKAAEKVTGYTFDEMVGGTPRLWGGQMDPEFYRNMWDIKKNKKSFFVGEIKNIRKSGESYTAIVRISPILNDSGILVGFVATEVDISDRERLENDLKTRNDELARLNKFMVGRELKMRELKEEIANLKK